MQMYPHDSQVTLCSRGSCVWAGCLGSKDAMVVADGKRELRRWWKMVEKGGFLDFNTLWEANELQKKARATSPNMPKFTCCLFLFITKAASLQHVPCFQQWQHLVKPPGSAGEGQGFAPGSEVGFHSCTPDQRNWEGIQDVGYNPQTPTPKLFSVARAWFLNLPFDFC